MGLILNVQFSGITVQNAYARVASVGGSKERVTVEVAYYANQFLYNQGVHVLQQSHHSFVPSVADDAPNFIKQGYEHIKTLPEFTGAVDA